METGKFWFIIIFVSMIAGVFTGVQYFQGVDAANAQVVEVKSKLSQIKDTLATRQEEWAKVSALAAKTHQAVGREAPLMAKREQLQTHIRRLEGDFKYMVKSVRDAVDKIRLAGVGAEFPEVKLTNGKILKAAKIKKIEPMNISFIHADGFTIVNYDELPEDIRERFDLGGNGLAEQLAATEQTIQTANYSGTRSSGKPLKPSKDHVGVAGIQTMEGLTINCPIPINFTRPPAVPPAIRQILAWEGKDVTKEISVNVAVMDAASGATMNLDGAIKGAIEGIKKLGVSNPSESMMDLQVSNLPAKKCSFSAIGQGQPVYIEMLAILKAERMYLVQTLFSNKDPQARELANAVLTSVKVE